jgi:cyclophilin family peptidyl-prolyl cis-trans isomerase
MFEGNGSMQMPFERFRVRAEGAIGGADVEEEAVDHAGKDRFGDPLVLAASSVKRNEPQHLSGAQEIVARQRHEAAEIIALDLTPDPIGEIRKPEGQHQAQERQRSSHHPHPSLEFSVRITRLGSIDARVLVNERERRMISRRGGRGGRLSPACALLLESTPNSNQMAPMYSSCRRSPMKSLVCALGVLAVLVAIEGPASAQTKNPIVVIATNLGDISLELDAAKAPLSVANFLAYVKAGHYDGTIFHRVIKGFMIQGGGMTPDMREKPTRAPIKNEAANGLKNERGTVAMARTGEVDSATSQFFINTGTKNAFLDHKVRDFGYAVFAKVVSGMDVVDKIESVKTAPGDVPVEPVLIKSIRVKS